MQTLGFNQLVTLKSDPSFRGYAWGRVTDNSGAEKIMVAVKHPGKVKTHVNSNVALPEADVEPVKQ